MDNESMYINDFLEDNMPAHFSYVRINLVNSAFISVPLMEQLQLIYKEALLGHFNILCIRPNNIEETSHISSCFNSIFRPRN